MNGDPHELLFARLPIAEGRGFAPEAPQLPAGFTDTFTSRYIDAGEVRLHAVIGGGGPPPRWAASTRIQTCSC